MLGTSRLLFLNLDEMINKISLDLATEKIKMESFECFKFLMKINMLLLKHSL